MTLKHGWVKKVRQNTEANAVLVLGVPMLLATAMALLLMWLERV